MRRLTPAFFALALLAACQAPTAPAPVGSASPSAAPAGATPAQAGATPATGTSAPAAGGPAAVTLTSGGAAVDVEAEWTATAASQIMILNKTALAVGPKSFSLKLEFDPTKTKPGPAGYVLPGFTVADVFAATALYKDAAGKVWTSGPVQPPTGLVLADTTARLNGTFDFKMAQAGGSTTQTDYKLTFDLPYPKAP